MIVTEHDRIPALVAGGALFVVNDSGGKDSQAMRIRVTSLVPREQIVVVHATLGEVEWAGALEHARDGAAAADVPFIVAQAPKTLIEMVEHRFEKYPGVPAFPQASNRQCTSDLKRDPIMREVRRYAKARGMTTIVTCMGRRRRTHTSRLRARKRPAVLRFLHHGERERRAERCDQESRSLREVCGAEEMTGLTVEEARAAAALA